MPEMVKKFLERIAGFLPQKNPAIATPGSIPPGILFVAMPTSIHAARWLSQFENCRNYKVHVFPSSMGDWHNDIINNKNLILHNFGYPKDFKFLNISDKIINDASLHIGNIIRKTKPAIIHTLQIQHSGYLVLPLKIKYKESFPLWFCSAWGGDISYYGQLEHHKKKTGLVLENIDALFSGDLLSINIAKELYNFNKPVLNVPSPGGIHTDHYRGLVDFTNPSQRRNIAVKGYTGGVHRPEVIFKALEMCAEDIKNKNLSIVVYMPGISDDIFESFMKMGINVIKFKHTENHGDVLKMFATARINVACSITDGVPNSMIEGMIMGAFPIQSNSGSVEEYVSNGINGFLLEPTDIDGFAEKLKVAIHDDDLVDAAVDYSYKIIKSKMDYETVKEKVFEFYDHFKKGN